MTMHFRLTKPTLTPHLTLATLVLGLALSTDVRAAPVVDDLDNWLADKGLLSQIQQVRHSVNLKASELVVHAIGFLGVPYQRGGNTAETGFDCSGFVKAIYEQTIGLVLPRRAEQQAAATQNIDQKDLVPGDLVFFNTMRRAFSHVGIYIGDGKFIHSPKPGSEVRVESLAAAYWNRRFDGARRVNTSQDDASSAVDAALRSRVKSDALSGAQTKR
jgi:cell wall-associated NlpC family hydrolase